VTLTLGFDGDGEVLSKHILFFVDYILFNAQLENLSLTSLPVNGCKI
jgi:hypothetical protein